MLLEYNDMFSQSVLKGVKCIRNGAQVQGAKRFSPHTSQLAGFASRPGISLSAGGDGETRADSRQIQATSPSVVASILNSDTTPCAFFFRYTFLLENNK